MRINNLGLMILIIMSFFFSTTQTARADEAKEETKSTAIREINKHSIGIGIGQTFLFDQFDNYGDDKISFDLLYSYTASYSFDLLVNAHSSSHKERNKEVKIQGLAFSIKARTFEFDAFSPYLLGGLGFYIPQITNSGKESDKKTTFGANFGGGVDLRLNDKVFVGVMAQYHKPFEVEQDDTADINGSYLKLLITTFYMF